MTGPDHYREAERLLGEAVTSTDRLYGQQDAMPTLLAALVHSVLGLTAATATDVGGTRHEWHAAMAPRPGTGA